MWNGRGKGANKYYKLPIKTRKFDTPKTSQTSNCLIFYVIKSVQKNGKNTSEIVEKLGTENFIKETYGVDDDEAWAHSHIDELNAAEKAAKDVEHFVRFSTNELIPAGKQFSFNTGYLFLQRIYYQPGLPSICKNIKKENSFTYDLNDILSRLVYGRILFPSSKLSCFEQSKELLEQPEFDARPVYLHRDDRIKTHFLTCFISLMIYRILEKQQHNSFTCEEIINTLRKMNVREIGKYGYIPNYTRTELTDALHDHAGFRTDNELTTPKAMAGIIRRSKGL